MPTECYYGSCPFHDKGEPLCYEEKCRAGSQDREMYETARRLERMGYDLEELDKDNPHNQWMNDS